MATESIEAVLRQSLADRHLSRSERQDLQAALREAAAADSADPNSMRRLAFQLAREAPAPDAALIAWLEAVHQAIQNLDAPPAPSASARVLFTPGHDCVSEIVRRFELTRQQADVAVFTVTDDRITHAILDAHQRGIRIRLVTDNDKAGDLGSDADRLARAGIPVRFDPDEAHMHHKFAVFDQSVLLTGSYNWTRGAAELNHENIVVTDDPALVGQFLEGFERLWNRFRDRA
jgi:phosphatidylserine/phosphatidylglycerophosphate/cardiolipin synthase-like enzyme